jgi:bacillithiol biosynthesis cysteine-adding enzyme BshC
MKEPVETQCYPITVLPHTTALFRDYTDVRAARDAAALRRWYPADPFTMDWARHSPALDGGHRERLAAALKLQAEGFGAGAAALANIERLRNGAAAVVTGQQVGLFGGPLLTLLKAATAVRKAQDATRESGREHVPVFWLATEDHDLAEVDQVSLLTKTSVETLKLGLSAARPLPVGGMVLGGDAAVLERASELLGWAPVCDVLRECYAPEATLAEGFGKLLTRIFAQQGLIVMDAASREFHALGAPVLRYALRHAEALETALLARSKELEAADYHAQVLVVAGHSLLFLIDADTGARLPLRRGDGDEWKAGTRSYSTAELLAILEAEPERLSPNALLRPVFQDCILPTAAYVGGPAEVAYFAQSAVVYEQALGRVTPVLPRLSATLVEPAIAAVMQQHEVELPQVFEAKTAEALAQRLGARAMPIEGKRKLAAAGNAMDAELTALTEYMTAMSADLGRSAEVSASKMRYQMDRLRRMAATFEVQKQAHLLKHATAIVLNLFPEEHPQERLLAGLWFLARYGEALPGLLVEHAGQECPGHRVIYL